MLVFQGNVQVLSEEIQILNSSIQMGIISGGWYEDKENPRESVKRRTNACLFAVTISK
jgi:hypothetical protein